jgi:hypothetical protein
MMLHYGGRSSASSLGSIRYMVLCMFSDDLAKEDSTLIDVFVGKRCHCQLFLLDKKVDSHANHRM